MLFMLAAGLTLIFGIMGVVNLTHGSFYMVGAYCAAYAIGTTGSFLAGVLAAAGAGLYGLTVEILVIRRLCAITCTRCWRPSACCCSATRRSA